MERSGSRIRDADSGINIPDHISEIWAKNTLILRQISVAYSDPEFMPFLLRIRDVSHRAICLKFYNFDLEFLAGV